MLFSLVGFDLLVGRAAVSDIGDEGEFSAVVVFSPVASITLGGLNLKVKVLFVSLLTIPDPRALGFLSRKDASWPI